MVAFDELLGRELPFKVTEVDEEKTRLLISNRGAASDERMAAVRVGEVAEGIVTSVQPYGAFVDINGVAGLLHISQISHDRITNVDKVLSEGDRIKVRRKEAPAPAMPATLLGTLRCSCSALAYGFRQGRLSCRSRPRGACTARRALGAAASPQRRSRTRTLTPGYPPGARLPA